MTDNPNNRQAQNSLADGVAAKREVGALTADANIVAISETIVWHPISASRMPDSDLTVQLFDESSDEPVWPGYFDGEQWIYVDGNVAHPTHYADMPIGPKKPNISVERGV